MLGACIGDICGSKYEFNNIKTKDFKLFDVGCSCTDDSIMTLAVCDILQNDKIHDKEAIIDTFKKWGRAYPNAGYGSKFYYWVLGDDRKPYNSCGNGAAMRVSACGWYANSEKEVKEYSRLVTEVTHNHPEGIKGAEVTAMCIYYARIGKDKEYIREYAEKEYPIIKSLDYIELQKTYKHEAEICQNTVPQAIYCFLISNDFEDCIRTTISIGGDCDTTAAISCAIAEAYYGKVGFKYYEKLQHFLPLPRFGCNPLLVLNNAFVHIINDHKRDSVNNNTVFVKILNKSNHQIIDIVESDKICEIGKSIVSLCFLSMIEKFDFNAYEQEIIDKLLMVETYQEFCALIKECNNIKECEYCFDVLKGEDGYVEYINYYLLN